MNSKQLIAWMATSTICAVAFGYFLASLNEPQASAQEPLYTAEFADLAARQLELLESIAALSGASALVSASPSAPISATEARRVEVDSTPADDLEGLIQKIELLTSQLQLSIEAHNAESKFSQAKALRRAASSTMPRNEQEIFKMIDEVTASEVSGEAQDAFRRNNMLTMDEALDRFGRPDAIDRESDGVYWGYEQAEPNGRGGTRAVWSLDLQFQDGLLVSVGGAFYDN